MPQNQRRHSVPITNFTAAVKAGDLLLFGTCSECRGDVERVVEVGWLVQELTTLHAIPILLAFNTLRLKKSLRVVFTPERAKLGQ